MANDLMLLGIGGSDYSDPLYGIAAPSLDLQFAANKSLTDVRSGNNLVTFTRASSGTYVGSDGVLRTATTNLLLQSEDFSTTWTNLGSSENTNVVFAPNGTKTADALVDTAVSEPHALSQTITLAASTTYTFSAYLKKGSQRYGVLVFGVNASWGTGAGASAYFDLQDGVVKSTTAATASITNVGNDWYRCIATATTTASASSFIVRISSSETGTSQTYLGTGAEAIYIWGAQLEQSSTVGEYIPTTSTINSAPRFDHNPTTGESLGLLVEEQRTNSIRNNTMQGAVAGTPGTLPTNWSISNTAGLTTNVVGVGTQAGVTYIDVQVVGTSNATAYTITQEVTTQIAALVGQNWTFSSWVSLVAGSFANVTSAFVDIRELNSGGSQLSSGAISISLPTSSFQRISASRTTTEATTAFVQPRFRFVITNATAIDFTLRIGLPQLEQGAFATSVIPTTGTAATRSADVASVNTLSPWFNATEGTLFAEAVFGALDNFKQVANFNNASSSELLALQTGTAPASRASVVDGGIGQATLSLGNLTANTGFKISLAYKENDFAAVLNGGSVQTDAAGTLPTVTQMNLGGLSTASGVSLIWLRRITYFRQRLSNANLQRITQ